MTVPFFPSKVSSVQTQNCLLSFFKLIKHKKGNKQVLAKL